MNKGIFITGTNTGVGKTVVARAMIRALIHRGFHLRVLKPVESGARKREGSLYPTDAAALVRAAKMKLPPVEIAAYVFEDPVSPHLAAARAGANIDVKRILKMLQGSTGDRLTIAEGAGGLLVPLSDKVLYADVIASSGFGLIIVAPDELGAINSTLLTIEAARHRQIPVIGVILNRSAGRPFGNAEAIAQHGCARVLGRFPEIDEADEVADDILAKEAEKWLPLSEIISAAF